MAGKIKGRLAAPGERANYVFGLAVDRVPAYNVITGSDTPNMKYRLAEPGETPNAYVTFDGIPPVDDRFIIGVDTTQTGTSGANQFEVPLLPGEDYDFDWETSDGQSGTHTTDTNLTITFPAPGVYAIFIGGTNNTFPTIYFNDSGDRRKLGNIFQWGNIVWSAIEDSFRGCENMVSSATDVPDWSNVTSGDDAFRGCQNLASLTTKTDQIDVSNFTGMPRMFDDCSQFVDTGIEDWDVSNVNVLLGFLRDCTIWNGDLSSWFPLNCSTFQEFAQNTSWTGAGIGSLLSGGNFTNAARMCQNAPIAANTDLTNVDFSACAFAGGFLQNTLFNDPSISTLDTSSLSSAASFLRDTPFDQDISALDFSALNNGSNFLDGSNFSTANYDALLLSLSTQTLLNGSSFGVGTTCYSDGAPAIAKADIVDNDNWTIVDGGSCNNENLWLGTASASWNDPNNWLEGSVPSITQVASFASSYNNPCDIDVNANCQGVFIKSGYTETITQDAGIVLDLNVAGYLQEDGVFVGGDSLIQSRGGIWLSGGTLTLTSGTTELDAGAFNISGGTLNHNNGLLYFSGNGQSITGAGLSLYDVIVNHSNANSTFFVYSAINIENDFSNLRGRLVLSSVNVSIQGNYIGGVNGSVNPTNSGRFDFNGTTDQEIYIDKAGGVVSIPGIGVNKASGNLTLFDRVEFESIGTTEAISWTQGAVLFDASFVSIKAVGFGYYVNWPAATAPTIPLFEQSLGNPSTTLVLAADFTPGEFNGIQGRLETNGFNFGTIGNFTQDDDMRPGQNDEFNIGGDFSFTNGRIFPITGTWKLNVTGTAVADNVIVTDSDASGGSTVNATNSTDSGNNTNWNFI